MNYQKILELVDGKRTGREIAAHFNQRPGDVARLLAEMVRKQLLYCRHPIEGEYGGWLELVYWDPRPTQELF